jgi:hypothetical protein
LIPESQAEPIANPSVPRSILLLYCETNLEDARNRFPGELQNDNENILLSFGVACRAGSCKASFWFKQLHLRVNSSSIPSNIPHAVIENMEGQGYSIDNRQA